MMLITAVMKVTTVPQHVTKKYFGTVQEIEVSGLKVANVSSLLKVFD